MDIDRPRLDIGVASPDAVENLFAGEDPPRVFEKEPQQPGLCRPDVQLSILAPHTVGREIHGQVREAQHLVGGHWTGSPQHRADAGDQLGRRNGLVT